MAKILNFPCSLDDKIRIKGATKWIPTESKIDFSVDKEYPLLFNSDTEEWYVLDDLGRQNYAFCYLEGNLQ
ncbi:hypothetical protein [Desulfitobacterium sp.]|uniref:hypothetical protein n=1 Tax=Desulfitobacterium sp. TaxID=49981 RepID=UPI002B220BE3|nr:hypothetical protein [Desulfitobacterium sp.]MEA4900495.1 hypothetical protein [Desulfitobacterium sp.]